MFAKACLRRASLSQLARGARGGGGAGGPSSCWAPASNPGARYLTAKASGAGGTAGTGDKGVGPGGTGEVGVAEPSEDGKCSAVGTIEFG
jgi:hypothetical protein